jgi:hypothetical protein
MSRYVPSASRLSPSSQIRFQSHNGICSRSSGRKRSAGNERTRRIPAQPINVPLFREEDGDSRDEPGIRLLVSSCSFIVHGSLCTTLV